LHLLVLVLIHRIRIYVSLVAEVEDRVVVDHLQVISAAVVVVLGTEAAEAVVAMLVQLVVEEEAVVLL